MDRLPTQATVRIDAAHEAIERLGLLKPEAWRTIDALLPRCLEEHPRSVCSKFRKTGDQISNDEKRQLGIRANAAMSRDALIEISATGLEDPIRAHETTLLRASFVMMRHRTAQSIERMLASDPEIQIDVVYEVFHPDACAKCKSLDETEVPHHWGLFPDSDCTCITAPYSIRSKVEWLAPVLMADAASTAVTAAVMPKSPLARFKAFFRRR